MIREIEEYEKKGKKVTSNKREVRHAHKYFSRLEYNQVVSCNIRKLPSKQLTKGAY
jgi:hypothetical protein